MLEESRLWACWAAAHVQRQHWAVLAHQLRGLRNPRNCKSKAQEWGCVFSWCVSLHYRWFEGRMAFGWQSSNARGSSGVRKGQEVPEKCWKWAAAPEIQAPHRVGTFVGLNPIPLAAQTLVALVFWRQRFPIRCLQWPEVMWEYRDLAWLSF